MCNHVQASKYNDKVLRGHKQDENLLETIHLCKVEINISWTRHFPVDEMD